MLEAATRIDVVRPLGNVNVNADTEIDSQSSGTVEEVIGTGERRMDTNESSATSAKEALVLRQPTAATISAMSVSDAVRADNAYANLRARLLDDIE
jgi:hypothetical protein